MRALGGGILVPPGDDCAVLPDGTALTVDALVEGVHWDDRLSPEDVGYKVVTVSVSDLAAMGARPAWMLLAFSGRVREAWLQGFSRGVAEASARWDVPLIGGDVTTTPGPTVVSATLGGPCVSAPVRRSTARPGDAIWVTGTLGLGAAGYLLPDPPEAALAALRRPDPPLALALSLARSGVVTAMMDLSDGLASDLPRLCALSGVGARVDPDALPLDPSLRHVEDPLSLQVGGGEDYQLLFTAPPDAPITDLADDCGVQVTRVGVVTAEPRVILLGRPWPAVQFAHFGAAAPPGLREDG